MKIALVILHADPARGGAERYTVDLAAALAKRGHDVSLLASSFSGDIAGVRNVPFDASGATRARRYKHFLDAIDREHNRGAYDIVHAMLPVRRCDVYHPHAGMAAEQMRKWNRLLNPRRVAMAKVERELLLGLKPPMTIALSEYVKRSILRHYTLPQTQLVTLFNAVDLDRFIPHEHALLLREKLCHSDGDAFAVLPDEILALIIANDFHRKGLKEVLDALGQINSSRLKLLVVGADDNDAPYVNHAFNLPAPARDCICFYGRSDDTVNVYRAADIFVMPTKHDPCSLVVLEALAMGLPVISTVFNGATEIMTDGVHGFVLKDPSDVAALADAMRKMLDAKLRAKMREACLALRPQLSYEHHLDQLMRIYERALSGSHLKSTS